MAVNGRRSVLTVHFITAPLTIHKPLTITFGLMASPVRPIPHQPFACRTAQVNWPKEEITFSEWLRYPHPRLSARSGTVEFWLRRTKGRPSGNTGIFSIGNAPHTLQALLLTPTFPNTIELIYDGQVVIRGKVPAQAGFVHLALVWMGKAMRLYADGKLIGQSGKQPMPPVLRGKGAYLQLGAASPWNGYTGIVVDELRLSDVARYSGSTYAVPTGPFTEDAQTVLLDHLDDHFRPDGQNAATAAGGVPTIGTRFVKGKFGRGLRIQVAPPVLGLTLFQKYGIHITSVWDWYNANEGFPPVLFSRTRAGIRKENAAYKAYGIHAIPYLVYPGIASVSPIARRFAAAWEVQPVSTMPWPPPRDNQIISTSPATRSYRDYYAAAVAWAMKNLGYDGYYTDGLGEIYSSENLAGGCGYVDRHGTTHKTWPIFATRALMKRMYRLAKEINPHCVVVNHVSFGVILPTMSFSDVRYTGEHEDYENLRVCRIRFDSRPWGIYTVLLGANDHAYSPLHEMTGLLLGTSIWSMTFNGRRDMFRKEQAVINAYRKFGFASATFYRWFEAVPRYVTTADKLQKAALYVHPGRDVLLIAANYHHHAIHGAFTLRTAALRLTGRRLSAVNALTGQTIQIDPPGTVLLPLPKLSFILVKIQTK